MTAELDLAELGLPIILKSEIEAKLKELDVYIDEELPDYILVLLANKKSQQQMCKDLRLFFGSLTEKFVEWVQGRAKGLKTNEMEKIKEENSKRKDVEETNTEVKIKHTRRLSTHSDQKLDSTTPISKKKTPLNSPKSRRSDPNIRDQNSSLGKRKSRSPDSDPKARKTRIYQEVTDYLTSSRRRSKTMDSSNSQVSTPHNDMNMIGGLDKKGNTNDAKTPVSKRPSTRTTIQPFKTEMVTPPPTTSRSFEPVRNKSVSPVRDARVNIKFRGRERELSEERERKEEKRRFRSRSTPMSPTLRKPMEEQPRRKNQVRLRYFNTRARSPSPPIRAQQMPQLSSVVKIKSSNRVVRGGRNLSLKDEHKGSIRLVHKALSEAAASTARGLQHNVVSSKKRKPVLSRLGPQVDNSSLVREIRITPEKKRSAIVQAESFPNRRIQSKRTSFSDHEEVSQTIDPINAQFDIIKLSRTESTCSISDDDLFPPRENSPRRQILTNNSIASSDHDNSMFDSEEVLPLDEIPYKRKVLSLKMVTKPKFIVTLDGAQKQYRQVMSPGSVANLKEKRASIGKIDIKQRLGCKPSETPEQLNPVYNPPDVSPLSETLKATTIKPKVSASTPKQADPLTERCKFWPNCKLGDKCDFHHPSLPCKNFPYCKFNQKCHYVHPDCKFDPYCTKPDCPFLHRHPRNSFPNHFKSSFSYTPDNKSSFPTRSQLTWTPGQKVATPKEKEDDAGRHISERKFALEEVQTVLIPKTET